jgi:hypothetical protein
MRAHPHVYLKCVNASAMIAVALHQFLSMCRSACRCLSHKAAYTIPPHPQPHLYSSRYLDRFAPISRYINLASLSSTLIFSSPPAQSLRFHSPSYQSHQPRTWPSNTPAPVSKVVAASPHTSPETPEAQTPCSRATGTTSPDRLLPRTTLRRGMEVRISI